MGVKVEHEKQKKLFKEAVESMISELRVRLIYFTKLYDETHEEIYKRQIWRIEQKIKILEELL